MSAALDTRHAPLLLVVGALLAGVGFGLRSPERAVKRGDAPAARAPQVPAHAKLAVLRFRGAAQAGLFEDSLRRRLRATADVDPAALPAAVDVVLHGEVAHDVVVRLSDAHTGARIAEWRIPGDADDPLELAAAVAAKVRPKLGL